MTISPAPHSRACLRAAKPTPIRSWLSDNPDVRREEMAEIGYCMALGGIPVGLVLGDPYRIPVMMGCLGIGLGLFMIAVARPFSRAR